AHPLGQERQVHQGQGVSGRCQGGPFGGNGGRATVPEYRRAQAAAPEGEGPDRPRYGPAADDLRHGRRARTGGSSGARRHRRPRPRKELRTAIARPRSRSKQTVSREIERVAMTLSRRTFLRAAGVSVALPWLDAFRPKRAFGSAAAVPRRMVCINAPL